MLIALLLAMVMALSACNLIVKDPEVDARQVIVQVNGEEVTKDRFHPVFQQRLQPGIRPCSSSTSSMA